ncbi:UDP-N-acetylmuramoyl-tripeptide--D-alanyl-D-alanine ligase [Alkalimonas collagenimarina]|uniref:UDP-N-acetylmuramoyl-tripeptide--D-alanyl-D-alanine ligase n=1 Tax=Alkalimonas collagenimarina TaxID=400390 RepID=A0ABT9GZL1_9GAMM|nr:UDP-N-acetylmuramoyl-tripeptide--D-alanyl-D-alanine ligase [Alkalimonas collagenimarina]MDP4536490.1 UDP-N-acetylmuramoyl-tripeptide--D-alanyl-D-alanine ligase [Alkalimonas collagenimarina]
MITLDTATIATVTAGVLVGDNTPIRHVSTDSRAIRQGELFVALKGATFDGQAFVAEVERKGAAAVLVHSPQDVSIPQIIVADTTLALGQLAAYVKQQLGTPTVAVTGSAGKTTVKEMLAAILKRKGRVLATAGNFNNAIGVPLTLLRLEPEHDYAVVELGANHQGEIAYTSSLVQPDVAMITNVAEAHLEGFGDLAGVARAKGEIFSALQPGQVAVIPADSEFTGYWQSRLQKQQVLTFSLQHDADYQAADIVLNTQGCAGFELKCTQGHGFVQLNLPGVHHVANALVAAAGAMALGASLNDVQLGLAEMSTVKGRTQVIDARPGVRIIDDSYNASLGAVRAAIDLLASYHGYRVLVLGDMAELGTDARLYHEQVGKYAKEQGINLLFTLGVLSQSASDCFNGQGHHFSSRQTLVTQLEPFIAQQQDITILVKGSRSANMELVVQDLLASCQQEKTPC